MCRTTSQNIDSTAIYNAIVTFGDGSQLAIELVVIQTQSGDVFVSDLYDSTELDGRAIQSIELTSAQNSMYSGFIAGQGVSGASVVCFVAGTLIKGAHGDVRVETI